MIVQAPDNKTIDFGNLPPDQVQAAMQRMYPPTQQTSAFGAATDKAKDAMTFGLGSVAEGLGAGAANLVQGNNFGDGYSQGRNEYFQRQDADTNQHPLASAIGGVAGLAGSMAQAPQGAVDLLSNPFFKQGFGKYAANAGTGFALGAPAGFGSNRGDVDQQGNAALGSGITGAVLNTVLPPVLNRAIDMASPLFGRITGNENNINNSASQKAASNISDVLNRDNIDINSIPLDQNILQSGGNGATSRMEAIATRNQQGADIIGKYAADKSAELPADLSGALGSNFQEANYPALLDAIKLKAKTEAQPAYEQAYNAVTRINDPQINQALDRVVSAGDWPVLTNEAKKLASYEGETLGNVDATGLLRSFSTKDLDYMTRALRNLGQGTEGMGAFGNMTPLGAMRANTAGMIRNRLKDINPDFATATEQYAGDIATHEAAQAGKSANLFGSNWKQSVYDFQQLSPVEQKAWKLGQAENLQTMIANNPGSALKRMNSPQFAKVMQNFYSPDEYQSLISGVQQLSKNSNQIRQITGNSRTATRALQQASDASSDQSMAQEAVKHGPIGAVTNFVTDNILNRLSNSPVRNAADAMVAHTMLSSPFQLAGQQAGGQMPLAVSQALSPNPQFNAMLQKAGFGSQVPFIPFQNYLLSSAYGGQQ